MTDEKRLTIDDFRMMMADIDPMIILGRALAPLINEELKELDAKIKVKRVQQVKPEPKDYCPGCGEISSCAPELCLECLAVNAD